MGGCLSKKPEGEPLIDENGPPPPLQREDSKEAMAKEEAARQKEREEQERLEHERLEREREEEEERREKERLEREEQERIEQEKQRKLKLEQEREERERMERERREREPPLVMLEDQIPLEGREPIGALELAIEFMPIKGHLVLIVHQARGLVFKHKSGNAADCNPFLKVNLVRVVKEGNASGRKELVGKQKGEVKTGTVNPVFEQTFFFEEVAKELLDDCVLSVALFGHRSLHANNYLGELRIRMSAVTDLHKRRAWYPLAAYKFEKPTLDKLSFSNLVLLDPNQGNGDMDRLVEESFVRQQQLQQQDNTNNANANANANANSSPSASLSTSPSNANIASTPNSSNNNNTLNPIYPTTSSSTIGFSSGRPNGSSIYTVDDRVLAGIRVKYKYEEVKGMLDLTIVEVSESENPAFPGHDSIYINLLVLPDRSQKQKTKVIPRDTLQQFGETFSFKINPVELEMKKIELALKVGSHDFIGAAILDFLGKTGDFEEEGVLSVHKMHQNRSVEKGKALFQNLSTSPSKADDLTPSISVSMALADPSKQESLGQLSVGAYYDSSHKRIMVTVHEGRNLKACDKNGFSDPYVIVRIVPDEDKKFKEFKTKIIKKTLTPAFHEKFEFPIKQTELAGLKLNFMMWDSDAIGREFMGEITLELGKIPLDFKAPEWYDLGKRNCGELNMRITLNEQQQELVIEVVQAKNLLSTRPTGILDPYVKVYLQPDKGKHTKRKTATIKHTDSPLFSEKLEPYDLAKVSHWRDRSIVVSVHDDEKMTKHAEVGSVAVPMADLLKEKVLVRWFPLVKLLDDK